MAVHIAFDAFGDESGTIGELEHVMGIFFDLKVCHSHEYNKVISLVPLPSAMVPALLASLQELPIMTTLHKIHGSHIWVIVPNDWLTGHVSCSR